MKILYLASRTEGASEGNILREMDALSRQFSNTAIHFEARLTSADKVVVDIASAQADILHITTHGESDSLEVRDAQDRTVVITPENLKHFITNAKCRLIYLNACNSAGLAEILSNYRDVEFAIGSATSIQHEHALQGALSFYARLLVGDSIDAAFEVAKNMVSMLSSQRATIKLFGKEKGQILVPKPVLLARFSTNVPTAGLRDQYQIYLGAGHVGDATLVIFFTDEQSYISSYFNGHASLGGIICSASQEVDPNGAIWSDRIYETWYISSATFRRNPMFYAVGVNANREVWVTKQKLWDALLQNYRATDFAPLVQRLIHQARS